MPSAGAAVLGMQPSKKPPIDALRLFGKGGILALIMHELLEPAFVPVIPRQIPLGETGLTTETASSTGATAIVIRGIVPGVKPPKHTDPDGKETKFRPKGDDLLTRQ